jgi:signal transduction histidine kinase
MRRSRITAPSSCVAPGQADASPGEAPRVVRSPEFIVFATLFVALCAIALFVTRAGMSADNQQIEVEKKIVAAALEQKLAGLGSVLAPEVYWDAAYDHITDHIDREWADDNLGPYTAKTSAISILIVIGPQGRLIYGFDAESPDHRVPATLASDGALRQLVARAFAGVGNPPRQALGFEQIGNATYLAAASAIVPNNARADHPLDHVNAEIYLRRFSTADLAAVQRGFGLRDLAFTSRAPRAADAALMMLDSSGRAIGFLTWQPARPGTEFVASIVPFAVLVLLTFGGLQMLALRDWRSTLEKLRHKSHETIALRQEIWARTMFLANISHELRTPLNAVLGFSEMMVLRSFGTLNERYASYADLIHQSGQHLLQLVNDVLELSRLQHDDPMQFDLVDVVSVAGTQLRMLEEMARQAQVKLVTHVPAGCLHVAGTEKAIAAIILNLGSNALKFTDAGKSVAIDIASTPDGRQVRLVFEDQGCGIPAESIPLLGRPFYQAQSSFARKAGTGLGLSIVCSLVSKMGGTFAVESAVGRGSRFTIMLNLAARPGEEALHAA